MAKICYTPKKFSPEKFEMIEQIERICEAYQEDGLVLTLRQCYYQCVSENLIENTERSYKNLGKLIADGRLAGLLDWDAFEDRTRNYEIGSHWNHPHEILHSAAQSYHRDWWEGQDIRPEVWVEKQALENVIERISQEYDVGYFCCRGYVSLSEMHVAAQRIRARYKRHRQETVILYLGDHDPSGIDMDRDVEARLKEFRACPYVSRIALNMNQIREYNPPPNPAKMTDSRSKKYVEKYGESSWELDSMSPRKMHELIEKHIKRVMVNPDLFADTKAKEGREKYELQLVAEDFEEKNFDE